VEKGVRKGVFVWDTQFEVDNLYSAKESGTIKLWSFARN